jgi:hypothetical protein
VGEEEVERWNGSTTTVAELDVTCGGAAAAVDERRSSDEGGGGAAAEERLWGGVAAAAAAVGRNPTAPCPERVGSMRRDEF